MIDESELRREWMTTAEVAQVLGEPRNYALVRRLHLSGYLPSRLELTPRKVFWLRREVSALAYARALQRQAGPRETYSASATPRSKPSPAKLPRLPGKPSPKAPPMTFARRGW